MAHVNTKEVNLVWMTYKSVYHKTDPDIMVNQIFLYPDKAVDEESPPTDIHLHYCLSQPVGLVT